MAGIVTETGSVSKLARELERVKVKPFAGAGFASVTVQVVLAFEIRELAEHCSEEIKEEPVRARLATCAAPPVDAAMVAV